MFKPAINITRNVAADVDMIGTFLPAGPMGFLPTNAFLLRSTQPVLIDTGVVNLREATLAAISELIDPSELRWVYLTHADADHIGCVEDVLQLAPRAKLITTFLGFSKLGLSRSVAPDRVRLLNPGETLDIGDRQLRAFRPPVYDAPETTVVWDESSATLFSSDCFGALVPEPVEAADQLSKQTLGEAMAAFLGLDSPWIHSVDEQALQQAVGPIANLGAETVLSAHLPPARNALGDLVSNVLLARTAPAFVGPNQAAFEQMMASAAAAE